MVQDAAVLQPILENPRMPALLTELKARWKKERQLRAAFYEKIQPGDKWEFINGKTIMHSPAKKKHIDARKRLSYLFQTHLSLHALGEVFDENALVTLTRNDYLPDIVFFGNEKAGKFNPDTWKFPAPDFVVEVLSDSTKHIDRGIKKDDYAAHGTKEYWLVDPQKQVVEQYLLDGEKGVFWLFTKKTVGDHIECQAIAGLRFPVAAVFDEKSKLETVRAWLG